MAFSLSDIAPAHTALGAFATQPLLVIGALILSCIILAVIAV
ncbi:MAG: hypothetical protein ACREFZ_11975 [Acetobacteraceae bacterium]